MSDIQYINLAQHSYNLNGSQKSQNNKRFREPNFVHNNSQEVLDSN